MHITQLHQRLNKTQRQIAADLGVSPQSLSAYISGRTPPRVPPLYAKIESAYDLRFVSFFVPRGDNPDADNPSTVAYWARIEAHAAAMQKKLEHESRV